MIDPVLLDYLRSGSSWLLVGSGVSSQMEYPSWQKLAQKAMQQLQQDRVGFNMKPISKLFRNDDFPAVFQAVHNELKDQLLEVLKDELKPKSSSNGKIYELLAKWPIPVYLTTNWDNEIQKHLARINEPYVNYTNKESDMSQLLPHLSGAIFKLHGELTTPDDLIMTTDQYNDITNSPEWQYWRTKMTSIFQMNKIIIIGHSLTDKNIKHVLELAKNHSGVNQPLCWIAPDVPVNEVRRYLEKYRIRVISYNNQDNTHNNLLRLLQTIDKFVPKREKVRLSQPMANVLGKTDASVKGLAGFHVFNKMFNQEDYEEKRISILLEAIQSVFASEKINKQEIFSVTQLLCLSGWPESTPVSKKIAQDIFDKGVNNNWFEGTVDAVKIRPEVLDISCKRNEEFNHLHERLRKSLDLRIKRFFTAIEPRCSEEIIDEIDNAIISFFQNDGLTLAQCLFSKADTNNPLPTSLAEFLTEASCKFDTYLNRQIFSKVTLDIFINPTDAERDYLGRISQGYFAFHTLGVLGDTAIHKLRHVKNTVWLIDSDAIIYAMALYANTNAVFSDAFEHLKSIGGRYFVTDRLNDEAFRHLKYANDLIIKEGEASPLILAAAEGTLPYNTENQFLQGFINWQAAGNSRNWQNYLTVILGDSKISRQTFEQAMIKIGFEIVTLDQWTGFTNEDFALRDTYTDNILSKRNYDSITNTDDMISNIERIRKKSEPESEALVIIEKERKGAYHILTEDQKSCDAWFISHTNILNSITKDQHITWQTEQFLNFINTLPASAENVSKVASDAFQLLLLSFAKSGITVIKDSVVIETFGPVAEDAKITISKQEKEYSEALKDKYSTSPNNLISQLDIRQQPIAAVQIANEAFQRIEIQKDLLATQNKELEKKVKEKEEKLKKLTRYENKLNNRANKSKKKKRKIASRKKKKKK